jgi:hypothetical protein
MKRTILNFKDFLLLEQSKYSDSVPYGKLFEANEADYVVPEMVEWIKQRLDQRLASDKNIMPADKTRLPVFDSNDKTKVIESIKNVYIGNTKPDDSYLGFVLAAAGVTVITLALLKSRGKLLKPFFDTIETFIQKKFFKKTYAKSKEIDRIIKFAENKVFNISQNAAEHTGDIKSWDEYSELIANAKEIMISEDLRLIFKSDDLKGLTDAWKNQNIYKLYSRDIIKDLTVDKSTGNLFYENVQVKLDINRIIYHPRILQTITGKEVSTLKEFVDFLSSNIKGKFENINNLNQVYDAVGEAVPTVTTKSSNIMTSLMKITGKSFYGSLLVSDIALLICAWNNISDKIFPKQNQTNPYGTTFIEILKRKFEETEDFKKLKTLLTEKILVNNVEVIKYENLPYAISYHLAFLVNEYVSQVAPAVSFAATLQRKNQTA